MAAKPRIMIRLDPGVLQLLEWYARARARPTADLAAELIGQAVAAALADADLRGLLIRQVGDPPPVPLASAIGKPAREAPGIAGALAELRSLGEEMVKLDPNAAGRIRLAASRVEGALVLLRDALEVAQRRHVNGKRDVVLPAPPTIDFAQSCPERGIVSREE